MSENLKKIFNSLTSNYKNKEIDYRISLTFSVTSAERSFNKLKFAIKTLKVFNETGETYTRVVLH